MSVNSTGQMTLLAMTQDILRAMGSDEVNTIGDTIESMDVVGEIEITFYEMLSGLKEPDRSAVFKLQSLSDVNRPNYLEPPNNSTGVDKVYYNYEEEHDLDYREIPYVKPVDFIEKLIKDVVGLDTTQFQEVIDFNGVSFPVRNDQNPCSYTSFDDKYFVFDSYDKSKDDTLQESKNFVLGYLMPDFKREDSFIPPIPVEQFSQFLAEAKSACFMNIKQSSSPKDEQRARRQKVMLQNDRYRARQNSIKRTSPHIGGR